MKNMLLIIFVLLFIVTSFPSGNEKDKAAVAVVTKIIKDVEIKKDKDWKQGKLGETLETGNEVRTGKKSLAIVKFLDNSLLRVQENSVLKIYADKVKKDISKNTHLEKGELGFKVTKQEDEDFKFTTPTMVASIRGTEGFVEVKEDGSSLLSVETGAVDVEASVGSKQSGNVTAGKYVLVTESGDIEVKDITPDIKKKQDRMKKTNVKTLILKTNKGDLKIEYLDE